MPINKAPVETYQTPEELEWMIRKVKEDMPRRDISIMEIGSMYGGTLWQWLDNFKVETLVSIDMLVPPYDARYINQKACHESWERWASEKFTHFYLFEESSHNVNVIKEIEEKELVFDVLFIDGDHTYDAVKKDFFFYRSFVRKGGIVILHDIDYNEDSPWYGVKPFWNEIKKYYDSEEFVQVQGERGLGILYV